MAERKAGQEEALLRLAEKLESVEVEKLEKLVDALVESVDALAELAALAKKLKEAGILAALDALVDASEEEFSAIARPDIMGMVSNIMLMMWLMGQVRGEVMFNLANKTPPCIEEAYDEFRKPHKRMGLFELINLMRSPEFAAALKATQKMLTCLHKSLSQSQKK